MNKSEAGRLGRVKSKIIHEKHYQDRVEAYNLSPKCCRECNVAIPYKKRLNDFCSQSCSAICNNRGNRRHGNPIEYTGNCAGCGVETSKKKQYCSKACRHKKVYKDFIGSWLSGEETGVTCNGMATSHHIHKWIRENRGDKCEECGWARVNPKTGSIPLNLEHSDGNSQNNRPENLKLLCPNCHSLTPTYGSLNKGKGRPYRYKRIPQQV